MMPYVFELDAGRACLDFANTLSSSQGEHLTGYADLVAFAEQSQLITPEDADRLRAATDAASCERVMARAYRLRAAIYATFSALAADASPDAVDLEALNAELGAALQHARVEADDASYRWGWSGAAPDAPLWGVARSAAELLISDEDRCRVRECGGDECRWLFLDTSKNHSRQWCSMQSCGNRQKARRHYQRLRAHTSA